MPLPLPYFRFRFHQNVVVTLVAIPPTNADAADPADRFHFRFRFRVLYLIICFLFSHSETGDDSALDNSNRDDLPVGAVGGLDVQLTEADLEERNKRRVLVKERITLTKASPDMWTDDHDAVIDAWFNDDNLR